MDLFDHKPEVNKDPEYRQFTFMAKHHRVSLEINRWTTVGDNADSVIHIISSLG